MALRSSWTDDSPWSPVDVYADLDRLEKAIALSNAEADLDHKERLATLSFMAAQRRPIDRDWNRFVLRTMVVSLVLILLRQSATMPGLFRVVDSLSILHFWVFVVMSPFVFWVALLRRQPVDGPSLPKALSGLDRAYLRLVEDFEDPKSSCRDWVRCLVEQWMSSVGALLLVGWFVPVLWSHRLVTRLGAWAALQHYPELWFWLVREDKPRPLTRKASVLPHVVSGLGLPWSLTVDLSYGLSTMSKSGLGMLFGGLGLLSFGLGRVVKRKSKATRLEFPRLPIRVLLLLSIATILYRSRHAMSIVSLAINSMGWMNFLSYTWMVSWRGWLLRSKYAVALLGPCLHMCALLRSVRIVYQHDVSLALEDEKTPRQWRYRFEWKKPERVAESVRRWTSKLMYWFFFSGTVEDQLRQEFRRQQRLGIKASGLSVWQQVAAEGGRPLVPRSDWKKIAMEKQANALDLEYTNNEVFNDGLGVALYKVLGLGLGFDFDHFSDLDPEVAPSARRLQARAAKSAIKHAQTIHDPTIAKAVLDRITNPTERDKKAKELREQANAELSQLKERLTDLIPTDSKFDGKEPEDIQRRWTPLRKTAANEYTIVLDPEPSDAIQSLTETYSELHGDSKLVETSTNLDDDFMERWLEQAEQEEAFRRTSKDGDDPIFT